MVYRVGDIVSLRFDACMRQGVTDRMLQYQGRKFRISKIKSVEIRPGGMRTYYELKGFTSEQGVPYAVTIDMLQPVKGAKYGK